MRAGFCFFAIESPEVKITVSSAYWISSEHMMRAGFCFFAIESPEVKITVSSAYWISSVLLSTCSCISYRDWTKEVIKQCPEEHLLQHLNCLKKYHLIPLTVLDPIENYQLISVKTFRSPDYQAWCLVFHDWLSQRPWRDQGTLLLQICFYIFLFIH